MTLLTFIMIMTVLNNVLICTRIVPTEDRTAWGGIIGAQYPGRWPRIQLDNLGDKSYVQGHM